MIDQAKYNSQLVLISQRIRQQLKSNVNLLSQLGKGDLANSVRTKTKKSYGDIESISFAFARHGVFFQKGVGRGYVISGNKVVRQAQGKVLKPRQPKDWLSSIDLSMPEIAELVELYNADKLTDVIIK